MPRDVNVRVPSCKSRNKCIEQTYVFATLKEQLQAFKFVLSLTDDGERPNGQHGESVRMSDIIQHLDIYQRTRVKKHGKKDEMR